MKTIVKGTLKKSESWQTNTHNMQVWVYTVVSVLSVQILTLILLFTTTPTFANSVDLE